MREDLIHGMFVTIPTKIAFDNSVNPKARLLYGAIASLSTLHGYCFASNSYLGEFMNIHEDTVSGFVTELIKKGFIIRDDVPTKQGIERRLMINPGFLNTPAKRPKPPRRKHRNPSGETAGHNNIRLSKEDDIADSGESASSDQPSLYTRSIDVYDRFCKSEINVGAKIDGAQGKAMKAIISYLKTNSVNKSDDSIIKSLEYIFSNWGQLDSFLRGQMKLTQINSNLTNILNQLRNGSSGKGNKAQALRDLQALKDSLGRSQSA